MYTEITTNILVFVVKKSVTPNRILSISALALLIPIAVISAITLSQTKNVASTVTFTPEPTTTPVVKEIVGSWSLSEKSGKVAKDSSFRNHSGTIMGSGSFVKDKKGYWVYKQTPTTNNYINLGDIADFELQTFTISAWVKLDGPCNSFKYCGIFSKGSSGNMGYGMGIRRELGYKLELGINDKQYVRSITPITTGVWHHVAATVGNNAVILYIDGVLDTKVEQIVKPRYGNESAKIGNQNDKNDLQFNGSISDVSIYNYALTLNDINVIYLKLNSRY